VSVSFWVQDIVVALLVLASGLYTVRRLAPRLSVRCQAFFSGWLNQPARPVALRALGRFVQPGAATGSCGDGCGTCGSCGTPAQSAAVPDAAGAHTVTFHTRRT
jgi:hypothetical protein